MGGSENLEVAEAVVETAIEAVETAEAQSEAATTAAEVVIEAAVQAVDDAQETAQDIARAAIETELGRRVDALERMMEEWHALASSLPETLSSMSSRLVTMEEKLHGLSQVTATMATQEMAETEHSSSIPPTSPPNEELAETVEAVTEVVPELHDAVEESLAPEPPERKRIRRFL